MTLRITQSAIQVWLTDMRVEGIIVSINGNIAKVRIVQNSACVSCGENCASCHKSVSHEIYAINNTDASVGEKVWVHSTSAIIYLFVVLLYLLPLVALALVYVLLEGFLGEGVAAVVSLLSTLLIFVVIYLTIGKAFVSNNTYSVIRKI